MNNDLLEVCSKVCVDKLDAEVKVFNSVDAQKARIKLQLLETKIDELNYKLFVANKLYKEELVKYREMVGLPVNKEVKDASQA